MTILILACVAFVAALTALVRAFVDHCHITNKLKALELRALNAERLLRERGALAGELAHEIKNPITAILCSADALDLLIGSSLDENHRKCLTYVREYGDSLLRLVSDFLDLSRLESGQVNSVPEKVEVKSLIESILGLLQSHAQQKKITLRSFIMVEDMAVHADPRHCKQVLFNLVHNAIKFTAHGGEIQVVAKSDFPLPQVRISVRDNGCGIPKQHLDTIFDPYKRLEEAPISNERGFGLGLAVCKGLIQLANGKISVESEVGVGTCFEICLPQYIQPAAQGQTQPDAKNVPSVLPPQPLSGQRFLLVDNDQGAREAMAQLIQALGGTVDQVELATQAIEAVSQTTYTTVLADTTGDGLYGYELAQALTQAAQASSNHGNDNLPTATILVAAHDEEEAALARANGADACYEKPLNGKTLLASLAATGKITLTH